MRNQRLPLPMPTKNQIMDYIKKEYPMTTSPTSRYISPAAISDSLLNTFGYRYYIPEIRNLVREIGFEPFILPTKVSGYYLKEK